MAPRFVTGSRKQDPRENAPPSTPRRPPVAAVRPAAAQATPGPSSNQFARKPQFTSGRTPQSARGSRPPSPPKPHPGHALRTQNRAAEDVEDAHDDEHDEMLDNEQIDAVPTIESRDDRSENDLLDLPFSPKRRRVDELRDGRETAPTSPARPMFQHPTTPASHLSAAPPHFARPHSVVNSTNGDGIAIRRPAFLRSSMAPSEQEPVPEAFSPHRRGEKFVPGGMAASLQQWVIEAGQAAMQSRKGYGYMRGEEYVLKVTVVSVNAAGSPLLVRGREADGVEVMLLLVVSNSKHSAGVSSGIAIGVGAPTWQVALDEIMCTVCVDWKIL